jgi:hypothetical protein
LSGGFWLKVEVIHPEKQMEKVSHTNETQKFMHVGSVTIPPGETRDVDPSLLDGYVAPSAEKPAEQINPLVELLAGNAKSVVSQLQDLSDEDLIKVDAMEQDGNKRKTVVEAIAAETLRRAQNASQLSQS